MSICVCVCLYVSVCLSFLAPVVGVASWLCARASCTRWSVAPTRQQSNTITAGTTTRPQAQRNALHLQSTPLLPRPNHHHIIIALRR